MCFCTQPPTHTQFINFWTENNSTFPWNSLRPLMGKTIPMSFMGCKRWRCLNKGRPFLQYCLSLHIRTPSTSCSERIHWCAGNTKFFTCTQLRAWRCTPTKYNISHLQHTHRFQPCQQRRHTLPKLVQILWEGKPYLSQGRQKIHDSYALSLIIVQYDITVPPNFSKIKRYVKCLNEGLTVILKSTAITPSHLWQNSSKLEQTLAN